MMVLFLSFHNKRGVLNPRRQNGNSKKRSIRWWMGWLDTNMHQFWRECRSNIFQMCNSEETFFVAATEMNRMNFTDVLS